MYLEKKIMFEDNNDANNNFPEEEQHAEEPLEEEDLDLGEEEDDSELPPDHPLIKRLQDGLKKQLQKEKDKLDVEKRDKLALKNKLSEEREEIGVQLYTVQQQLAKLQAKLTDANEQRAQLEAQRNEETEQLKQARQELEDAETEYKASEKEYESQRDKLDKLNEDVLRLEKSNLELASQVAGTRRQAYKSDQSASETEVTKKEQDLYIDRLTNQIKDVSGQIQVIEAQINAQRSETKLAQDALLQANHEMDLIKFEHEKLVQSWMEAIVDIKNHTKMLEKTEALAASVEENIRSLQNEYAGLKAQISDQQELSERNRLLQNKINSRLTYLKQKIEQTKDAREKEQEQLTNLSSLIKEKESLISRLQIERNAKMSEFKLSQKDTNGISNKIHEIEGKILEHVSNQSDLKRDALATQNEVQKLREQIEAKDRELSDIQNEVMRLKFDKLTLSDQCQKVEQGLAAIVEELQAKDNIISQYESQIRRNNVDIEKRQSDVDKLNRKYDELTSAQNGEEYGPLERKIRQIQSKIQLSDQTTAENQAIWLKKQTELVALEKSCDEIQEANTSQQAHIAVLSRKRDRTRNQLAATEKEIERLNIQIRLLQREMSRLGEQLSASVGTGNNLIEGNINFEAEILENLRKKEEESASTEMKIEEVAQQREDLAQELMETERAIMMWEKKLQLAREMKEALDPNYGASELKSMKKEVSRMELRLSQIEKQQENIIKEMEFALLRRETIADRGAVQKRLNKDKTRSDVTKGITALRRQAKSLNEETAKYDELIQSDTAAQRDIEAEIEQLTHIMRESEQNKAELEAQLKNEENAKAVAQARLEKLHQKSRYFQAQGAKTVLKSQDAFESAFQNVKNQENQLISLIDNLAQDFPQLAENLKLIKEKVTAV